MMTLEEAIKHAEEVAEQNEWFDKNCLESMQCRECAEEYRQLAEWLKELKRLREQTRWIPVSERYPDKDGEYLVTVEGGWILKDMWIGIIENWKAVTAWMPLPEPFSR